MAFGTDSDTASPGSQRLTLSLSGSLTGHFIPVGDTAYFGEPAPDPEVSGSGTINTITISGHDPSTNQVLSATIRGSEGRIGAASLGQYASISSIPQPLLAMLTTPGQYQIMPNMGGGTDGIYYGWMWVHPLPAGSPVPTPEPSPFALAGLVTAADVVRRARARKDTIPSH